MPSPTPDPIGDIFGGRERSRHSRELTRIAIDLSLGNRDAAEIKSIKLQRFGITREKIQHFVDHAKLHSGSAFREK